MYPGHWLSEADMSVRTGRLMRHLGAMGYIIETGVDEYKPTNFSNSLTIPIIADGYPCM